MWITRQAYNDIRDSGIANAAIATELKNANTALQTTMDWMRIRLNQVEHERAQLIHNYMGVKITVPDIQPARSDDRVADALNDAVALFRDVGDAEAKRLSIDWDEEGNIVHG